MNTMRGAEMKIAGLDLENEPRNMNVEIRSISRELNSAEKEHSAKEEELGLKLFYSQLKIKTLEREMKNAEKERRTERDRLVKSVDEMQSELQDKEETISSLRKELAEIKYLERQTKSKLEAENSCLKSEMDDLLRSRFETEKSDLKKLVDACNSRLASVEQKQSHSISDATYQAKIEQLSGEVEQLEENNKKLRTEKDKLSMDYLDLVGEYEKQKKFYDGEAYGMLFKCENALKQYQTFLSESFDKNQSLMDLLKQCEAERKELKEKYESAQKEIKILNTAQVQLLGHKNSKQKIQIVQRIKQENENLKEEVLKLTSKETTNRRRLEEVTAQLDRSRYAQLAQTPSFIGLGGAHKDETPPNCRRTTYDVMGSNTNQTCRLPIPFCGSGLKPVPSEREGANGRKMSLPDALNDYEQEGAGKSKKQETNRTKKLFTRILHSTPKKSSKTDRQKEKQKCHF